MSRLHLDDTIAAIATAPGEGAIGIVRLSGPEAAAIARRVFRPARRGTARWRSHRLYHGHVVDPCTGARVDEVLLAYMRAPHSYTRQDVVEISAHGGAVGLREILRLAIAAGARPAERGELTLRAFLNGRLDLAQAEAVLDAVRARTPAALSLAIAQLSGGLSGRVAGVREAVLSVYARLEATIDFAEDDVPPPSQEEILTPLVQAGAELGQLLATARAGRLHREGVRVAIVGRPNAGKSSLLNALLQSERAIVTPIPGTTRDLIEESIDLGGIPAVLVDTAGIVETADPVERIGVQRSREALAGADVALFVFDASEPLQPADAAMVALAKRWPAETHSAGHGAEAHRAALVVLSKNDLPARLEADEFARLVPGVTAISVSAVAGRGLDRLRRMVREDALGAGVDGGARSEVMVASARHRDALERAQSALHDALASVQAGLAADFACIDLRACLEALGEITGETVTDDLLDRIFDQFCIGK